jgi:tight adherence protein C
VTAPLAGLLVAFVVAGSWVLVPGAPVRVAPAHSSLGVLARLGRAAAAAGRRVLGRPSARVLPTDQATAIGAGLVVAVAAPLIGLPWPAAGLSVVPVLLQRAARRRAEARAEGAVVDDLPEVLDLLGLVVGAGGTPAHAIEAVGRRGAGPLAAALADACRRAEADGVRLADALADVPGRLGPGGHTVRPLLAALGDASRHGTALGPSLDRLGADARIRRRQRAEARARRVPVLLLFPLVTCTLPALGLLTVAPLLIGSLRSLRH